MMKYLSRVAVALTAIALAYGISSVFRINHFVWTLLKERYYQYVSIFLPLLAIWCCVYLFIHLDGVAGFIRASVAGLVGGYVCGLVAFLLLPIFGSNAAQRILTTPDLDRMLFLSPIIAFSWLTGLLAGCVVWCVRAKRNSLSGPKKVVL